LGSTIGIDCRFGKSLLAIHFVERGLSGRAACSVARPTSANLPHWPRILSQVRDSRARLLARTPDCRLDTASLTENSMCETTTAKPSRATDRHGFKRIAKT
jgi:hypothetical protein